MLSNQVVIDIKPIDIITEIEEDDDVDVLKKFHLITGYSYYT